MILPQGNLGRKYTSKTSKFGKGKKWQILYIGVSSCVITYKVNANMCFIYMNCRCATGPNLTIDQKCCGLLVIKEVDITLIILSVKEPTYMSRLYSGVYFLFTINPAVCFL